MGAINVIFVLVIFAGGIVVLGLLIGCYINFKKIINEFDNIEKIKREYSENITSSGDVMITAPEEKEYDRGLLETNRERFNTQYSKYVAVSQLISLFPLIGILGTVWGLMVGGDASNIEVLISGLSIAMITTFMGLVCSIILKMYDSICTGKIVNDIDSKFNTVDAAINRITLENIYVKATAEGK